jgi:hypothetical protein
MKMMMVNDGEYNENTRRCSPEEIHWEARCSRFDSYTELHRRIRARTKLQPHDAAARDLLPGNNLVQSQVKDMSRAGLSRQVLVANKHWHAHLLLLHVFNGLGYKPALTYGDANDRRMPQQQTANMQGLDPQRDVLGRLDDVAKQRKEVGLGNKHCGMMRATAASAETLDVSKHLDAT